MRKSDTQMQSQTGIQTLAARGAIDELRSELGDALIDQQYRSDAITHLARAYFALGKYQLANYLFHESGDAADRLYPDTAAECTARVEAAGFTEDFSDSGHVSCPRCDLRYRAEYQECLYCPPAHVADDDTASPGDIPDDEPELQEWEESAADKISNIGHGAAEKFKTLAASKSVRELADRAKALGQEAGDKIQDVAKRDEIRRIRERAKKVVDNEATKELQESATDSVKRLSQHAKAFVEEERSRYDAAPGDQRRIIALKWIVALVVFLIALRVLAWIL